MAFVLKALTGIVISGIYIFAGFPVANNSQIGYSDPIS
jgi:hypothetical protein